MVTLLGVGGSWVRSVALALANASLGQGTSVRSRSLDLYGVLLLGVLYAECVAPADASPHAYVSMCERVTLASVWKSAVWVFSELFL